MTWWKYVQTHAAGEPNSAIAKKLDISASSIGRWVSGGVDPLRAAAFARAYGRPVLEAFVAAGFLTEEEAGARVVIEKAFDPTALADEDLIQALAERMTMLRTAYDSETERLQVERDSMLETASQEEFGLVADDADGHDHEDEDEGLQTDP